MTTLREAAQEALAFIRTMNMHGWMLADHEGDMERVVAGLEAALAQPAPEPVAWRIFDGEDGYVFMSYEDNENYAVEWAQRNPRRAGWVEPIYTAPPQRPEPDTDCHEQGICQRSGYSFGAAPARCPNCSSLEAQNSELDRKLAEMERKPLTEEEIEQIADRIPVDDFVGPTTWHIKLVRAAEQAHGIKE